MTCSGQHVQNKHPGGKIKAPPEYFKYHRQTQVRTKYKPFSSKERTN